MKKLQKIENYKSQEVIIVNNQKLSGTCYGYNSVNLKDENGNPTRFEIHGTPVAGTLVDAVLVELEIYGYKSY